MTLILFICFLFVHLSFEECVINKKVSITIDLEEDNTLDPLEDISKKILWHVAILRQEEADLVFLCSGTMVGASHVVTAASCVADVEVGELRVVAGLTFLRSPHHSLENPHSVFAVTKKYCRYHTGDSVDDDVAVLKLKNKALFRVPQPTTLKEADKYSKHCFALGWGLNNHFPDKQNCPNPSFQDSIKNVLSHNAPSGPILNKVLDIRNYIGFSSTLIFQMSRILDILPTASLGLASKNSQDLACSEDGFARVKAVKLTTKRPYKCLCRSECQLCLYSVGQDALAQQVDIGSPVFCKLKNRKENGKSHEENTSKFVFAGIITNKKTEEVRWLRYGSSINMLTATNVTALIEFILTVIFNKD